MNHRAGVAGTFTPASGMATSRTHPAFSAIVGSVVTALPIT